MELFRRFFSHTVPPNQYRTDCSAAQGYSTLTNNETFPRRRAGDLCARLLSIRRNDRPIAILATAENGGFLGVSLFRPQLRKLRVGDGNLAIPGLDRLHLRVDAGERFRPIHGELESADSTVTVQFPNALSWGAGYAHNSGYSGPVSAVVGSLALSNALSQAVFSNSEAELILTYTGPDVDVGMQGNTLQQDLAVSLSGGPLEYWRNGLQRGIG